MQMTAKHPMNTQLAEKCNGTGGISVMFEPWLYLAVSFKCSFPVYMEQRSKIQKMKLFLYEQK